MQLLAKVVWFRYILCQSCRRSVNSTAHFSINCTWRCLLTSQQDCPCLLICFSQHGQWAKSFSDLFIIFQVYFQRDLFSRLVVSWFLVVSCAQTENTRSTYASDAGADSRSWAECRQQSKKSKSDSTLLKVDKPQPMKTNSRETWKTVQYQSTS